MEEQRTMHVDEVPVGQGTHDDQRVEEREGEQEWWSKYMVSGKFAIWKYVMVG